MLKVAQPRLAETARSPSACATPPDAARIKGNRIFTLELYRTPAPGLANQTRQCSQHLLRTSRAGSKTTVPSLYSLRRHFSHGDVVRDPTLISRGEPGDGKWLLSTAHSAQNCGRP